MLSAAIALLVLLTPGMASAATAGAAHEITSQGLVAAGNAGDFTVTLVVPSGPTTGASTVPGVDFGKPWASFFELGTQAPLDGIGHSVACPTQVINPTSFSAGYQAANYPPPPAQWANEPPMGNWSGPLEPVSGIYFDVTCNDGSGYDFYRVRWDDWLDPWTGRPQALWPGTGGAGGYWGSSVQDGGYHGELGAQFNNNAFEVGYISVWGHNATGFHYVADGAGDVDPQGVGIMTTVAGIN
jgi:hypothetical protein